ncbi:MAG: hypothetical protein WC091_04580 [Sulfuricellaceae bacterium]
MSVKLYQSTDTGAPVLSGVAGTLINLLDACLINGYGAQTPPETGAWEKTYTSVNKAVYRSTVVGGSGLLLRVDDTTTTYAAIRGYETMTDADTGTGQFPTATQVVAPNFCWRKSNAADATARPWVLIADDKRFYLFIKWHLTSYPSYSGNFWGDITSYKAGDAYHCAVIADNNITGTYAGQYNDFSVLSGNLTAVQTSKYLARNYNQIGSALTFGFMGDYAFSPYLGNGGMAYPSPVDNGLYVSGIAVNHGSVIRGAMPGLYQPLHLAPLAHGDTLSGVVGLPGKTLVAIKIQNGVAGDCQAMIDITGPWD